MKKLFLLFLLPAAILAGCGGKTKDTVEAKGAEKASEAKGVIYKINPEASMVQWTGHKFQAYDHTGTVAIEKGMLAAKGGDLTGGNFVIDMSTIEENGDGTFDNAEKAAELAGHLKNEDFFHVEKFPTSSFEVTKVEKLKNPEGNNTHKVSGNLTIKDVTKNISFPAKIEAKDGSLTADAEFSIDRADFNVKYGSKSFFKDLVDDNVINDNIDFVIHIEGTGKEKPAS